MAKTKLKWLLLDYNCYHIAFDIIVTFEQAKEYIETSKFSATTWKGQRIHYYSENGIVYIDIAKNEIRTAFSSDEFDEKIKLFLEVLSKNE